MTSSTNAVSARQSRRRLDDTTSSSSTAVRFARLHKLFSPPFDSLAGTLLSLSTFAIAFLARPLGADLRALR